MSTRSTISVHRKDGTIHSVYCHYDGYYEYNGVLLYNFYNNIDKVNELISYGDISSLGSEIGKEHNFNDFYSGCTFYHRDRKEDKRIGVYRVSDSADPYCNIEEEEYNYIFVEEKNKWIAKNGKEYEDLEDIFKKYPPSNWYISVSNEEQYEKMKDFYHKFDKNVEIPNIGEVLYEI